jgi:TIGR03009 family protein
MSQYLAFRRLRDSHLPIAFAMVFLAIVPALYAQDQSVDPGIAPNTDNVAPRPRRQFVQDQQDQERSGGARPRGSLPRPDLRVDPDDPQVDRLLREWSEHTQRIKYLTGKHLRSTRNYAFGVETLAEGKFFLEMPDRGRIDVGTYSRANPKAGDKHKYVAPDGKVAELTVSTDGNREKWICDGKLVLQIDDKRKTVDEIKIPPNQQGVHMIDGPLPFLLGMPPDKAKARYRFRLGGRVDGERIWIEVTPRMDWDAAEWIQALVLLNLRTYLPEKVKLLNPAKTTETIYLFEDLSTNERTLLQKVFAGDPFKPRDMWNYRREVHATPEGPPTRPDAPPMKMLVGAPPDQAKNIASDLKSKGYKVKFEPGPPARDPSQNWHIASQEPAPGAPLKDGQVIILRYYIAQTANRQSQ